MQRSIPTIETHLLRDGVSFHVRVELLGVHNGQPDFGRVFAAENVPAFTQKGQPSKRGSTLYAIGQEIERLTDDEKRQVADEWHARQSEEVAQIALEIMEERMARFESIPDEEFAHLGTSGLPADDYAERFDIAA
jgi:hypothetical protein